MTATSTLDSSSSTIDVAKTKTLDKKPEKNSTCCGRKVSLCNCISPSKLFTIITVVGVALLAFGILGLIGHFAPAAGGSVALQKIKAAALYVASSLGSDLFALSMFATTFGTAFALTGIVGLIFDKCQNQPPKKIPSKEELEKTKV